MFDVDFVENVNDRSFVLPSLPLLLSSPDLSPLQTHRFFLHDPPVLPFDLQKAEHCAPLSEPERLKHILGSLSPDDDAIQIIVMNKIKRTANCQ
jgi:hypothetical protein